MVSDPAVGRDTAEIMRIVLVLPAPLGPRKPKLSPRSMATSMPLTASKSPKRFTRPRASTTRAARVDGPAAKAA